MKTAVNFNKLSDRPALFQIPWKVYCYNNVISLFSEQKSSHVITNFAICYKSLQFDCSSKLRSRPTGLEAWQRMEEDVCHRGCVLYDIRITPLQRRLFTYITVSIQLKFSLTWNCVSPDAIHNFKWVKLFGFDKMEVNNFQILLNNIYLTSLKADI